MYSLSNNAIQGILDGREVRGWVGNSSGSPSSILHNISVIRTTEDCPLTRALLLDTATNTQQFVTLAFEVRFPFRNILQEVVDNLHLQLTAVVHPSGRCCKALRPSLSSNWTLGGLTFRVILEDNLQLVEGFQVHPTE